MVDKDYKICNATLATLCFWKRNMKPKTKETICGAEHVTSRDQCALLGGKITLKED